MMRVLKLGHILIFDERVAYIEKKKLIGQIRGCVPGLGGNPVVQVSPPEMARYSGNLNWTLKV